MHVLGISADYLLGADNIVKITDDESIKLPKIKDNEDGEE